MATQAAITRAQNYVAQSLESGDPVGYDEGTIEGAHTSTALYDLCDDYDNSVNKQTTFFGPGWEVVAYR